jgi:acyl-CoA reductase-like NAD-dependent aldehyde dehydrogenase
METFALLINGVETPAASGQTFDSVDPFSGDVWAQIARAGSEDVDRAVYAAHAAFTGGTWPMTSARRRGELLRAVADLFRRQADVFADIETRDNGKLIGETSFQASYVPQILEYYAGLADKIEGAVMPLDRTGVLAFTQWEALGVVAVITPWNSPLLIGAGKIANAIAAGCTVVVKPSEFTSASTVAFARLFDAAGFPPGVVNVVTGFGSEIGDALVTHPKVAKVTFTGSTQTGRRINERAASSFKKVSLELGGKSANIIFDDADLDKAVRGAAGGIFAASGQTCVAGSRLLVQNTIHDEVVSRLVDLIKDVKVGDPRDPSTRIGPIATRPQYERVLEYLEIARADGATCVAGGAAHPGKGQLVPPTIYTGVTNDMRIAREEVFGPVLSIIRFEDEDEAIRIANDSNYGLASGVWTSSMRRALTMSKRLEAGTVWINMYRAASFMMPLTGRKESGLGSENGQENIRHYMQPKSVWLNYDADIDVPLLRK